MVDATGSSALGRELTSLGCVPAVVAMLVASVPQPEREAPETEAAQKRQLAQPATRHRGINHLDTS